MLVVVTKQTEKEDEAERLENLLEAMKRKEYDIVVEWLEQAIKLLREKK